MKFLHYFLLLFSLLFVTDVNAQYELPTPVPPGISQSIPAGSLVIPMDTTSQKLLGYFNLKAYGLVNYLLQNEIPVKWAIRSNKTKTATVTGIDFSASCSRVYPDTTTASTISFRGGPFIIENSWVSTALPFITAFEAANGNKIAIYKLASATTMDIRYTLTFKPRIFLTNHQNYDSITVSTLTEAAYSASCYTLKTPAGQVFNETTKYSLIGDAHYANGDTTHINPVLRYVTKGGNLFVGCAGQGTYENSSLSFTTLGIDTIPVASGGSITNPIYPNHFLPISQYDGILASPNGEYKYWFLKSGSSFRTTSYQSFRYTSTLPGSAQLTVLAGAKIKPNTEKGGNIYYLGGHDYNFYTSGGSPNENSRLNGKRIFLNATLIPPADTIDLDFTTDVQLSIVANGFAVKNEEIVIDIIAKNIKNGTAKNVLVPLTLPAGLTYVSHSCGIGAYNTGTTTWNIGTIGEDVTDTLHLHFIVNSLGAMTMSGTASNTALETILPNNTATLNFTGVSRPVAENDTTVFIGPYAVDVNTYANDSDEDGGPFGNTSVFSGPAHGSVTLIGNNIIRYVPSPSYTGPDSLLYVTCDNYPLCDTAWLYIDVSIPLPVELSHFSGQRVDGNVYLNWLTLSEKENDYFAVERSSDGKNFEMRGKVRGAGTTNTEQHYDFKESDNNTKVLYYRLRQFDYNGENSLSKTIALTLNSKSNSILSIFPNPMNTGNELVIHATNFNEDATLVIYDVTGRSVYQKYITHDDNGLFDVIPSSVKLNSGCYIISVVSENENISAKLLVN